METGQRILLDTHAWLWMLMDPERFSDRTRKRIVDPATELFLSVASVWEIGIKYELGKLELPDRPSKFVPAKLSELGIATLSVDVAHALLASELPPHHSDPFDRLIIAQGQIEGLSILTADKMFQRYKIALLSP